MNYIIFVLHTDSRMPAHVNTTPSLAAGITLAPVRLGDLVTKPPTATAATETKSGYLPPHLRRPTEAVTKSQPSSIEVTESEFPSLGGPVKKAAPANKAPAKINFKKAVDDHLEREKQSEIERANGVEEDISRTQLEADGWAILSLKPIHSITANDQEDEVFVADEIHRTKRFSEEMEEEADRFFRAYMKISHPDDEIKIVKKIKTPTPLNDACKRYRAKMRSLTSVEAV